MNNSVIYAYATNLSGIFDHLNSLNERREQDAEFQREYDERNSVLGGSRAIDLEIISENSRDETGFNARNDESCDNLPIDDSHGL